MDYHTLFEKKERIIRIFERIPPEIMAGFYKSFDVEYAHNSTAIEGNTLTLIQTKAIVETCFLFFFIHILVTGV